MIMINGETLLWVGIFIAWLWFLRLMLAGHDWKSEDDKWMKCSRLKKYVRVVTKQ